MLYLTALQEGLLYGLLALGVYISLRVLDIPDLTTEGSSVLALHWPPFWLPGATPICPYPLPF